MAYILSQCLRAQPGAPTHTLSLPAGSSWPIDGLQGNCPTDVQATLGFYRYVLTCKLQTRREKYLLSVYSVFRLYPFFCSILLTTLWHKHYILFNYYFLLYFYFHFTFEETETQRYQTNK